MSILSSSYAEKEKNPGNHKFHFFLFLFLITIRKSLQNWFVVLICSPLNPTAPTKNKNKTSLEIAQS